MATTKRSRTDLTLSKRLEIVKFMEKERPSQTEAAKRFSCSQSTISKIVKKKEAILEEAGEHKSSTRKRKRAGKDDEIDAALYTWFVDARARDAPITSAILEEKANYFASMLKKEFKTTNGWLCRWKSRHGIKFKKAHGEKKDTDFEAAGSWKTSVLAELLREYSPRDVYNADDTGVYFRAVPDGTLCFSTDKLFGRKKAKDRVTVLVCVNMDGSDKRPLLVIGKSNQPRCFRGIPTLPTPYASNSSAWMTSTIFHKWLVELNRDMLKQDRHIVLLVDNCSAHPKDCGAELTNVAVHFLPPNVTSLIQPCDMGIIRNLKALYRKSMISRIVSLLDGEATITVTQLSRKVNMLDAMHMLKVAWNDVKPQSISNCFAKAGFVPQTTPVEEEALEPPVGMLSSEFESFVDLDASLECHGQLSEEDICSQITDKNGGTTQPESDDEDDGETSTLLPKRAEAIQAMQTVRGFLEKSGAELKHFYALEKQLYRFLLQLALRHP